MKPIHFFWNTKLALVCTCFFTCQQYASLGSFLTFTEIGLLSLQLQWLNKYYETIRRLMGPELDKQGLHKEKDWMLKNTEPFMESGSSASVCTSSLTLITLAVALLYNIIWASSSFLHSLHTADLHQSYPYAVSIEQLHHTEGCTAI